MARYVAVFHDDEIVVHADGDGNYDTFCGIDANDSEIGTAPAPLPKGAKIDCPQCQAMILAAKHYSRRDFARPKGGDHG